MGCERLADFSPNPSCEDTGGQAGQPPSAQFTAERRCIPMATTGFPAERRRDLQVIGSGEFHGTMAAMTPSGSRRVKGMSGLSIGMTHLQSCRRPRRNGGTIGWHSGPAPPSRPSACRCRALRCRQRLRVHRDQVAEPMSSSPRALPSCRPRPTGEGAIGGLDGAVGVSRGTAGHERPGLAAERIFAFETPRSTGHEFIDEGC
jgi:hypothetical protein